MKLIVKKRNNRWILLFLYFIAIFAYMPTARPTDRYIWIICLGLLLVYVGIKIIEGRISIAVDYSLIWYITIVLFGGISCFWAIDTTQYVTYLIYNFIVIIASVLCICSLLNNEEEIDTAMGLIVTAGCFAAIRFCYYTPWDTILSSNYYIRGSFGSLLDDVTNYNNYTSHLCILCIVALYYAIVRKKSFYYLSSVFLFAVLIFGGSRKNLVVIPLVAIFFSLMQGNMQKKLKALVVVFILLGLGWYVLFNIPFLSQIRNKMIEMILGMSGKSVVDDSTLERLYLIQMASQIWENHPIIGVGWDNFRYYNYLKLYSHNNYYEVLACLGIVGFLLYYIFFFGIVFRTLYKLLKKHSNSWDVLLLGVLLGYAVQDYGSITLYGREKMILLLILIFCCRKTTLHKIYHLRVT